MTVLNKDLAHNRSEALLIINNKDAYRFLRCMHTVHGSHSPPLLEGLFSVDGVSSLFGSLQKSVAAHFEQGRPPRAILRAGDHTDTDGKLTLWL